MATDSIFSKAKVMMPRRPSRQPTQPTQPTSTATEAPRKQPYTFPTVSHSSTKQISSEPKGDNGVSNAQTLSVKHPSPQTQPQTVNVVLFGETGVGKSSVINLIARKEVAQVSSDVNGCTMQYKCYDISFDNMNFAIFDTIGLEEPQMGVNGYLKAIEKAYELISKLGTAGGIHLLLFCMRGGRITATTQSNYRLFCECLCDKKVPIALIFTGLEREVKMEDWWTRNKKHIEDYGIKSDDHACITAVQDDVPGEDRKYLESQTRIRELLKDCARKNEAFSPESLPWFVKFTGRMRGFLGKKSPKKKDVLKILTSRCKLDVETAKRIAAMMEKGDTETNGNKDPQAGNGEDEGKKEEYHVATDKERELTNKPDVETSKTIAAVMEKDDTETNGSKDPQAGNREDEGGKEEYHDAKDSEEEGGEDTAPARGPGIVDAVSDVGNKVGNKAARVGIRQPVVTGNGHRVVTDPEQGMIMPGDFVMIKCQ